MTVKELCDLLLLHKQDADFVVVLPDGDEVVLGKVEAVRKELLTLNQSSSMKIDAVGDDGHPTHNCIVFVI